MVALVQGDTLIGGICGSEVAVAESGALDIPSAVRHLIVAATEKVAAKNTIERYLSTIPLWTHDRIRAAADDLASMAYAMTGLRSELWLANRANALQQRQIAETIHSRKGMRDTAPPVAEERQLLQLIRAGDTAGARRRINDVLAGMFLDAPAMPVLQARALELLGYLVRVAVEDQPDSALIMKRHYAWIERILTVATFEQLCVIVRNCLDDFMRHVATHNQRKGASRIDNALALVANAPAGSPPSLSEAAAAAGLSVFRFAHLFKKTTGETYWQHLTRTRIRHACTLLETTDGNCAAIAAECGFTDQSHFTRVFKSVIGIPPARWRNATR